MPDRARCNQLTSLRKFLFLTLPAALATAILMAGAIEIWVRATWDERGGAPGLFVSDAVLGQRLAPGYDGWFAGVPLRINNLGMRDTRDVPADKPAGVFRILVLGDSVTFGHGSVHTYPALVERLLQQWRPEVGFEVWNAAVPGYNTSQELAQLRELGPRVKPDLVIVGFFDNDLIDNRAPEPPSFAARTSARVLATLQRHVYSLQWYKRLYLTLAWRLSGQTTFERRLEHLQTESALLASGEPVHQRSEQQLTSFDRLPPFDPSVRPCGGGEKTSPAALAELQNSRDWQRWVDAVRGFQRLHEQGEYRVVFFVNAVPPICQDHRGNFFYEGGSRTVNDLFLSVMRGSTPAVSVFETFLERRPDQMPAARGHAVGNSNQVKAEVLFDFLRREGLVPPGAR